MSPNIIIVLIMLVAMVAILCSAVAALYWAASHGEFADLEEKSRVIFDEDEPIGEVTDRFPEPQKNKIKPKNA